MKHDQGPDSSSKPYRSHRSIWGSAGVVLGCPPAALRLMGRKAYPIQATLESSSGGGGLENQPNGSLIGGSLESNQPLSRLPRPNQVLLSINSSTVTSFTRQIK